MNYKTDTQILSAATAAKIRALIYAANLIYWYRWDDRPPFIACYMYCMLCCC